MQTAAKKENSISNILYRGFVGLLFGFANVIPGVSGGTVMVVLGVYERIIGIITDFRHKIKTEWKFFLPILVGMGVAIVLFGRLMSNLLSAHKAVTQMFFIGVIVFSIPAIFKSAAFDAQKKLNIRPQHIVAFLLVLALMVFMSLSKANDELKELKAKKEAGQSTAELKEEDGAKGAPRILLLTRSAESGKLEIADAGLEQTAEETAEAGENTGVGDSYAPDHSALNLILMVVYGAVACSTMIIPGISGSLVMVMMGQYENVMHAIKHFDLAILLPFGVGCLIGLIFCARLIRWLLEKHSQLTYAAILGFVLGSLLPVFPGWSAAFSRAGLIAFVLGGACIVACDMLSRSFGAKESK